MATKFGVGDDVGDTYPCAKFKYDLIRIFLLLALACAGALRAYSDSASFYRAAYNADAV